MHKFYLSYWSGGYRKTPDDFLIDMHKLCALFLNKHYGECYLITDSVSKDKFKNLPFKEITTELDEIKNVNTENWALGKLLTYKILAERKIPFFHIDYDVFLLKKLPEHFLESDVLVQSIEKDVYGVYALDVIEKDIPTEYEFNPNKDDIAYNVGIFGGTNLSFIKEYAEQGIRLTLDPRMTDLFLKQSTATKWDVNNPSPGFGPACTCEQYFLKVMSENKNVPITCLLPGSNHDKIVRERYSNEIGYVHLMSGKSKPHIVSEVYNKIRQFEQGIL